MNRKQFRIGPGAASILLIAVVLSMCVVGVLSLLNARNDSRLSVRAAAINEEIAELNASAEESLANLDAVLAASNGEIDENSLPEGMTMKDDVISWTEKAEDGRILYCAVRVTGDKNERYRWITHRQAAQSEQIEEDEIWN